MGLILDTSVLIDAERARSTVAELLERLPLLKNEPVGISSLSVLELASGLAGAQSEQQALRRRAFLEDIQSQVPIQAFDSALAMRTGLLNGELRRNGVNIGMLDLMIGVTALESDYQVVTRNVRHFQLIPGLEVVEF